WRPSSCLAAGPDRADEDLGGIIAAQAEPALADLEQARAARLQDAQPATGPQPQLGQPADPVLLARHLGDVGPRAAVEQCQREKVVIHSRPVPWEFLRFSLNTV